jgi:hypothetical protein
MKDSGIYLGGLAVSQKTAIYAALPGFCLQLYGCDVAKKIQCRNIGRAILSNMKYFLSIRRIKVLLGEFFFQLPDTLHREFN